MEKGDIVLMITDSYSTKARNNCCIPEKSNKGTVIEVVFYLEEFEYLLFGLNYYLDYIHAVAELQDIKDNFFHDAKTLSTHLMHLFNKSLKSGENLTVSLDRPSLENLLMTSDLILYMLTTQINNDSIIPQYNNDSIKKCHDTFLALKERIKKHLS